MVKLNLAPGVHAAIRGEDLVLLDIRGAGYACLPEAGEAVSLRPGIGEITVSDAEVARQLRAGGFINEDIAPSGPVRYAPPVAPNRDLMGSVGPWSGLAGAADLAFTLARASVTYGLAPFGPLVFSVARKAGDIPHLTEASPDASLVERTLQFRRLLPWIPFQGVCLYRSYMLLRHLRRRGFDALWVFGVQTWPFAAHCWLQVGETVLDDTADNAAAYTPILVV